MLKPIVLPLVLAVLAAGVIAGYRPASAATTFSVANLDTLAQASRAYAISNNGKVAGVSSGSGTNQAVLKDGANPLQGLGTAGGFPSSEGYSVNSSGVVVGRLSNNVTFSQDRGFVYQNGAMMVLPGSGVNGARAFDINDAGVIVGESDGKPGVFTTTTFTPLPALPNNGSGFGSARAVNAEGDIAGYGFITNSNLRQPFVYDASTGGVSAVPLLVNHDRGEALDISDNGVVVGYMTSPSTLRAHAFRSVNGVATDLGTLGGTDSFAYGVNDAGQIVGTYYKTNGFLIESFAFLWENGAMTDLNTLLPTGSGWTLRGAHGINDAGQVVGVGFFNGQPRGFILTPVPEPAATATVAALTVAALVRRRRRHHI